MYSIIATVLVAQFKIVVHWTFKQHFNEYNLYKKMEMVGNLIFTKINNMVYSPAATYFVTYQIFGIISGLAA